MSNHGRHLTLPAPRDWGKVVTTAAGAAVGATPSPAEKATFRDVFAIAEFRALWLAQLLSVAGDQLARVAMTVLVYDRTTPRCGRR